MRIIQGISKVLLPLLMIDSTFAFTSNGNIKAKSAFRPQTIQYTGDCCKIQTQSTFSSLLIKNEFQNENSKHSTGLEMATPGDLNLDVVSLVAGQENYGFALVTVGEALWSFLEAPSLDHAKILVPAVVSALILVLVSGPMITSGDANSVGLGLEIATAVSIGMGASYLARLLAPYSPSAKEIAFLGLLVALAGFFSFSQNLVVDGFVVLPSLPSIPLPSLPSIQLPF